MTDSQIEAISERYRRFARLEAAGRSPLYESLALGVAQDDAILKFLSTLPVDKRQPNLIFAAARKLGGAVADGNSFRRIVLEDSKRLRDIILTHSTQTNEPARCATLLPVLAHLPQPLALIEVGASAGLCLFPERYGYDYGRGSLLPHDLAVRAPVFTCRVNDVAPLPTTMPRIVWRAGLDLNPLDVGHPSHRAWLETLVWPEQHERLANLKAAIDIAARSPPRIIMGDLLSEELARLCREAPENATLVVFHTAVLTYVQDLESRHAFAKNVQTLCDAWVSNESAQVFPEIASQCEPRENGFLLSLNGKPLAWTDAHGASLDWIAHDRHLMSNVSSMAEKRTSQNVRPVDMQ